MISKAEAARPAVLVAVAAGAWLALVLNNMVAADIGAYLGLWTLMMTAMMVPSIAPLVQLQRTTQATMFVAAGYLAVWGATGFLAYAADMYVDVGAAVVLVVAAAYEVTPLKAACLRRCRAPVDFLFTDWHSGRFGAVRLGLEHAVYCIGCCWALMAVLVLAAAMNLAWAAVLAGIVFVQKILPLPRWSSAATAAAFTVAALIVEVT